MFKRLEGFTCYFVRAGLNGYILGVQDNAELEASITNMK
jgi:hypothetical protein